MTTIDSRIEQEYWSARKGVAMIDRSHLGRLEMSGTDALDLLHRLSTQDLAGLEAGQGALTVLTSEKGRIIDLVAVHHLGDRLLLVTAPNNQDSVAGWLDKYTIIEDCTTSDVTDDTALLAVLGPKAPQLAERLAGRPVTDLPPFHHVLGQVNGIRFHLARASEPADGGFHLILDNRAELARLQASVLEAGHDLGVRAIGEAAYATLRIEAGLPAFGTEMDERFNPLEAGLQPFISFDKGCYIGQEVVARLDTYDKVQKRLMGLLLPAGSPADDGTRLFAEGKEAGFVTSAALAPSRDRPIALGYIRSRYAEAGTLLSLESDSAQAEAEVVELPFGK